MSKREQKRQIIPRGTVFTVTSGAYSDYSVLAVCRAVADIDTSAELAGYLKLWPEQKKDYSFHEFQFLAWLLNERRLAEEVPFMEFHVGTYSCGAAEVIVNPTRWREGLE
ncbi:MAG: hypothetical protein K2X87_19240 [Gemmataceae bacterium]|nr:hypothetical protein [Gemmataceae bacterium]